MSDCKRYRQRLAGQGRLSHYLQTFDYGMLLPGLARLPIPLGETLAKLRGLINAIFDLDWRSLSLRKRYVRTATYKAMRMLQPQHGPLTHLTKTTQRFINASREEWEACLFGDPRMESILQRSTVEGLEPLLAIQRAGRGIVLLTLHYDSFCTGIMALGYHGLRINVISSSVVEHPHVHPAVQAFYERKYRGMERFMNGGKIVHHENDPRHFYRALQRGEAVVVLGDLPAGPNGAVVNVPFLNGPKKMAGGAERMARKTDSALAAFLCVHRRAGVYAVRCFSPQTIAGDDSASSLNPIYRFFESCLLQEPERWWAADLRPGYQEAAQNLPLGPTRGSSTQDS